MSAKNRDIELDVKTDLTACFRQNDQIAGTNGNAKQNKIQNILLALSEAVMFAIPSGAGSFKQLINPNIIKINRMMKIQEIIDNV